jgi:hypothetical protein
MNEVKQTTLDATLAAVGSKATYTGAGTSVLGWWASSEAGVIIGIVLGIIGLALNWYFRRREDYRQEAEHQARMAKILEGKL